MTTVLGINAVYHESSVALVVDGRLVSAVEEERFNRVKHAKPARVDNADELPVRAIKWSLSHHGVDVATIDAVGLSFSPALRRAAFHEDPLGREGSWGSLSGEQAFMASLEATPAAVRAALGPRFQGDIVPIPHHLCHAASAFYPSDYDDAGVLVVDGIAENACAAIFDADADGLREVDTVDYPHSLGFLWEKFSEYFGFTEYDACKSMGLAAYGDPTRFREAVGAILTVESDGRYRVDDEILRFRLPEFAPMETHFGPRRRKGEEFRQAHYDIAASLQEKTDEAMIALVRRTLDLTGRSRLCLAGGVALNCVSNTAIREAFPDLEIFIPTAPNDAGTAMGAALHLAARFAPERQAKPLLSARAYLGPSYGDIPVPSQIAADAPPAGCSFDELCADVVDLLCEGKVVGWFQGAMEFGPRALGNRSLLADPRRADMRDILNRKVKHREIFRPFAPSVLKDQAGDWFELGKDSMSYGYMLFAVKVREGQGERIPAVLHADGTARVQLVSREQNPEFCRLIEAFARRTGVPMLLNTSFNDNEPIVCSPEDALNTFRKTSIDALVLGTNLIRRSAMVEVV
ncbi:carbamoyltransferase [Breoghania corrubedonensis]|uniref:Carbamoyltransferase n=1 Tax=Breoghania corrubedonensis TaxID=665038 RepID=A0A2T5V9V2_9HYPH|nr:carbamoyltransferase C-terminal domain-containing protein [Breoghania corrubedonensis]PTW60528.1 carbamoyltransferase [Breoghania corrubedonensis]